MAKKITKPTSFRLSPDTVEDLDKGAGNFKMTRTQWLEFLAEASVNGARVKLTRGGKTLTVHLKAHGKEK